jgi:hypothetical protein
VVGRARLDRRGSEERSMRTQHSWQVRVAVTSANLSSMGVPLRAVPQRVLDRLAGGRPLWLAGELRLVERRLVFHAGGSPDALGAGTARFQVDLAGGAGRAVAGPSGWTRRTVLLQRAGTQFAVRMSKRHARQLLSRLPAGSQGAQVAAFSGGTK